KELMGGEDNEKAGDSSHGILGELRREPTSRNPNRQIFRSNLNSDLRLNKILISKFELVALRQQSHPASRLSRHFVEIVPQELRLQHFSPAGFARRRERRT